MRWAWLSLLTGGALQAATVTDMIGAIHRGEIELVANGFKVSETVVRWNDLQQAVFAEPAQAKIIQVPPGQLPRGWGSKDVGILRGKGATEYKDGRWMVSAFARHPDVKPHAHKDFIRFTFFPMKGDGQITARVTGLDQKARNSSLAGVCFRSGLTDDERNAQMALVYRGGARFRTYGMRGGSGRSDRDPVFAIPGWLRLERRSNRILGSWSADGEHWKLFHVGNTWKFDEEYMAGLFVIGHGEGPVKVTFDHVTVERADQQLPFIPRLIFRNGTEWVRSIESMDAKRVTVGDAIAGQLETGQLARIVLHPDYRAKDLPADRTGVLLRRGDFFEGDFVKLAEGELQVDSILFGPRTFDVATEVLAVSLAAVNPERAVYLVETASGSRLRATAVRTDQGKLRATIPGLGVRQWAPDQLRSVTRLAN